MSGITFNNSITSYDANGMKIGGETQVNNYTTASAQGEDLMANLPNEATVDITEIRKIAKRMQELRESKFALPADMIALHGRVEQYGNRLDADKLKQFLDVVESCLKCAEKSRNVDISDPIDEFFSRSWGAPYSRSRITPST